MDCKGYMDCKGESYQQIHSI